MPVVAIAGAAIAADAAITAATFTAVTALEAVAAVGGVLSAVGQITGNKGLAMAGTVLGVVGGIGALAGSAGLLGDGATSSLFGSSDAASAASDTSATAASDTSATAASDTSSLGDTGAAAGTGGDIPAISADPLSAVGVSNTGEMTSDSLSALQAPNDLSVADQAQIVGDGATLPASVPVPDAAVPANAAAPTSIINGAPNAPTLSPSIASTGGDATGMGGGAFGGMPLQAQTGAVADMGASPQSIFGKLFDFAHNNQTLTMGVLQAGGNFISGLTNPTTPAQIAALNAQAAANNAAAGLTNIQRQNVAMPKAVATNVTGNNTPPPVAPGLINSQPVTGSPSGIPVAQTPNSQKITGVTA